MKHFGKDELSITGITWEGAEDKIGCLKPLKILLGPFFSMSYVNIMSVCHNLNLGLYFK